MRCPQCKEKLREVERAGVMIDVCPACKGVWLDRGELDKLLEIAARGGPTQEAGTERGRPKSPGYYGEDDRPRRRTRGDSWLGAIFDAVLGDVTKD